MAYRKRVFLNPISTGKPSFIHALAESSDGGTYILANCLLIIADCNRRIMLKFPLTSKRARKNSLAKIDLLADIVNRFRDAVHAEATLIDEREYGPMPKDDSDNDASTNTPKIGGKDIPCPGCGGGPLRKDYELDCYVCDDCDWERESWEVFDSMLDK